MDNCKDFVKARDLDKQQLLSHIQIGGIGSINQAPTFGVQSSLPMPGIYNPNQTSRFQQQPFNYSNQAYSQPQIPQAPTFAVQSSLPMPEIYNPNQTSHFKQQQLNYSNQAYSQPHIPQAPTNGVQSSLPMPGIYNPNQTSHFQQQPFNYSNQSYSQPQQYYQNPHLNPQLQHGQQPGTLNHNQLPYPHQMLPGTWSPNPKIANPDIQPPK